MIRFHHVNLGVLPGGVAEETSFLVDVLGYRPVELDDELQRMGARWFEASDGSQVHLSEDPTHRAASRAHVAVVLGAELDGVILRLEERGTDVQVNDGPANSRVALCRDPAGNRWELRDS